MIESLEQRSLLATVNLGPVVPLAEGFGYGSTIAGLGKAMDLTAPDLYTNVLFTNSSSAVSDSGKFTMEAWLYPKPGQTDGLIWNFGSAYSLHRVNDTGLRFVMDRVSIFERNDVDIDLTASQALTADAWNHVAVTYDGERAQIFVNGVNVAASVPFNPDPTPLQLRPLNTMTLSFSPIASLPHYNAGAMDEIRVWNVTRTQAELQGSMLSPLLGDEPGLIGYWNFDNRDPNSPEHERDQSPSANRLFITKVRELLNAAPQIGYVEVTLNEAVTDVKGLWVAYDVAAGTATSEVDFTSSAFRKVSNVPATERNGIIIPKGAKSGRIYFVARPDAIAEPTESFSVTLVPYSFSGSTTSDYVIGAQKTASISIIDSGAYQQGVAFTDASGRAVTAASPLYVDPVSKTATFSVRLTSEPDYPQLTPEHILLKLKAINASVDDGRGAASELTLLFRPDNWDQPKTFTLGGMQANSVISITDVTPFVTYLSPAVTLPFTLTPPTNALAQEGSPLDVAPLKPTVNLVLGASAVEGSEVPGRVVVALNVPAPAGGLDVFYSVTSTAREGVDFQRLPGVIHVEAGRMEAEIPVQAIDNRVAHGNRVITVQLGAASTAYFNGTKSSVGLPLIDDDKARIVAVNPVTLDITQAKDPKRPPATGQETSQPFALNDDAKPSLGTVGVYDAPTWTYSGALGASFTAGQFDADRLDFVLGATADASAKIRVRLTSTDENGQPTVRLAKAGADGVNSVATGSMFDALSGTGTRLRGGSLASPRLPTIVDDYTLEWSLAGLPAGSYQLVLATTSNLTSVLANPGSSTGVSFRYEASFTSSPTAPYQVFTTTTVSSFSDDYTPLVTTEPAPSVPAAAEPNNTVASAYKLGTAYDEQLLTGQTIDSNSDLDLYRFKLEAAAGRPDMLVAEFLRPSGSVNPLLLDILNLDGSVRIQDAPRAQNQYVSLVNLPDGEYVARVRAANNSVGRTDYSLRFRTMVNPGEVEANNSLSQATYLGVALDGDRYNDQAIVGSTDQDFYRFTLNTAAGRPSQVSLITKNSAGALFFQLVNATTGASIAQAPGSPDVKTISLTGLADGDYALRVEGDNTGLQNKYDLAFGVIVPRQAEVNPNRIAFRLDTRPSADVVVTFTSGNTKQGTVSPSTLVFTPATWDVYQTLTVTPQDDGLFNGDVEYTLVGKASSSDPAYHNHVVTTLITNVDRGNFVQPDEIDTQDELAMPVVTVTSLVTTPIVEGYTSQAFRLTLDKAFGQVTTVMVDFSRGTAVEGTNFRMANGSVSPYAVVFPAGVLQRDVTITTMNDQVQRTVGGEPLKIRATVLDGDGYRPAKTADPGYTAEVSLAEINQAGFVVTHESGAEASTKIGSSDELSKASVGYTIRLNSKPKAEVIVPIASSDPSEGLLRTDLTKPGAAQISLRFTPDNWQSPQKFYVQGVDDAVADGIVSFHFAVSAAGDDDVYRSLKTATFLASNGDNDVAGLTISSPQATVAGRANVFSVRLNTEPIGEVRVTMTPRNDQVAINGERAGEPATLVFTSLNWNIPQLTQVAANDDKVVEFFHTSQIDFTVDSGRRIADSPSLDNSTAATAIPLGDIAGGLRIEDMKLPAVTTFPYRGEEWYRFRVSGSASSYSMLRLTTSGSSQVSLPKTEIYRVGEASPLLRNSPTAAARNANGDVLKPAILQQSLRGLAPGEYLLRILPVDTSDPQFTLWFDDGDRTYDALRPASIPVSIKDDDLPIAEILAGPTASEVSSEPSYFAVRLNAPANPGSAGVKVNFQVTGGSATRGTSQSIEHDYSVIADSFDPATGIGWVRVAPGDVQANIGIQPIDDKLVEDLPLTVSGYNASTGRVQISGLASLLSPTAPTNATFQLTKDTQIVAQTAGGRELTFTVAATTPLNLTGTGASATYRADVAVTLSAKDAADAVSLTQSSLKARAKSESVSITLLGGVDYVLPLAPDKQNASSSVVSNLDANRIQANLTIFDDDVPGVEITEVGEHTTLAEGDEAKFQVSLVSEPSRDVVLTLIPGLGLAFVKPVASTSETITPTRYNMTQSNAPDNLDLTLVSVDETDQGFTATFDARLTRPKITTAAQSLALVLTDTGAGTGVSGAASATTVFEIPASDAVDFAGNPDQGDWQGTRRLTVPGLVRKSTGEFTFQAKLGNTPNATITLTPVLAPGIQVATTQVTFTRANWFVPQTVTVAAIHDDIAQPGAWHKSQIQYRMTSQDLIWDGAAVPSQEIRIRDMSLNVGDTLDGLNGVFGALTMGLQGLEVPLLGSVGDLPGVTSLLNRVESPLEKSLGAQEQLTVQMFQEVAESSLQPLEDSGAVDDVVVTPSSNADEVRVSLHIEKSFNVGTINLDSDLGLEALGITFATTGVASVDLDFSFDVTIGWHRTFGFFVDTANTGIQMGAKLSLQGPASNPQAPFSGTGSIGFLQLDFTNDPSNPTELSFTFEASLNDLDNIRTTRFFDINGDGVLADSPVIYQVGVDSTPKDGRIDLDAQGAPKLVATTKAAIEPFVTINALGQSAAFPTVTEIGKAGDKLSGAVQANWNTTLGKSDTFDEAELSLNEGQYLKEIRGATTIVYFDANRNGRLDIARRSIDPATTAWTSLSSSEKNASEIWTTSTATGAIPEFRILTTGTGATAKSHVDLNRNNRADTGEEISAKLRKKLDKDNSKTLEADVRQDGEGAYVQGTSTAYYDWNSNKRQDFNEPFISYAFRDFELALAVAVDDAGNILFVDLDGDAEMDSNEPRVLIDSTGSTATLDLNANGQSDSNEPATARYKGSFFIEQSRVNGTNSTISFNSYQRPVLTVDGVRFIDLDQNGELTLNAEGEPLEPWATQRTELLADDINRLVQRIHSANPNLFATIRTDIEKLQAGTTLDSTAQGRVTDAFRAQVGLGRVVEQPSDGDRLTLAELNAFRVSLQETGSTRTDRAKSAASELFSFQFQGGANLGFKARTSIAGSTVMPSLEFDLAVSMPLFNYGNSEQADDNSFSVDFNNVAIDLGSFLQNYVEPILATANDVIGPIKPIVTALNADTKLLGKLGLASAFESDGRSGISLLEIARKIKSGNPAEVAKIDKAIKFAGQLQTLVETIDTLSESLSGDATRLEFGNFSLGDLRAASSDPGSSAAQVRSSRRADGTPSASTTLPRTTAADVETQARKSTGLRDRFNALKRVDGLAIHLFDPNTVMSLLMGESNVNLVTYDVPDFAFEFKIGREFRIWGPIKGKLEGGFNVATDISVGYDTTGIEAWSESGFDPLKSYLALDGIFVDDWTPTGVEKDELTVSAFVSAGVGIDIGIASGFVKGGVEGIVGFDIIDAGERAGVSDGKIRGSDIVQKMATAPADLFDLSGRINAFLAAEVKVNLLFFKKTVYNNRLATFELARFKLSPGAGSGSSLAGKVQTGPISGGVVWFDANDNLVRDDGEPFAITDFEGNYELIVPDEFDLAAGTIRVEGGKDASTGLDSLVVVATPVGGNATALTSLEEALKVDGGLGVEESQALIEETFGIDPSVNLTTFAHHDEALAGNPLAGPVMLAENNVNSLVHEMTASLAAAAGVALDDRRFTGVFSESVFIALSRHLRQHDLDLTNSTQLRDILLDAAHIANQLLGELESTTQVDTSKLVQHQDEIAVVLQTTVLVQRAVAAQSTSVVDLAHRVTQAKVLANGKIATDLYRLVRGEIPASELLADYGGGEEGALALIAALELPPLVSEVPDVSGIEDESLPPIPFTVRRQTSHPGEIMVEIYSDNDALLPDGSLQVVHQSRDGFADHFEILITPALNTFGSALVTLQVIDTAGESSTETFEVNIGWKNHNPIANDDTTVAVPGRAVVVRPLDNDMDIDEDLLHLGLVSVPSDGVAIVNSDGSVTYTPATDATGFRTLVYEVEDGNGGYATASITFELMAGAADLAVTQTSSPLAMSGHEVVFAFTISNTGPMSAPNVVVRNMLPEQATFVSAIVASGFSLEAPEVGTTGELIFHSPVMPHGATASFVVVARVSDSADVGELLRNTVSVMSMAFDIDAANNVATADSLANLTGARLSPSATDVGKLDVVVWGSSAANNIQVYPAVNGRVRVIMDRVVYDNLSPTGRVIVYAGAGNDIVRIDPAVKYEAVVFGDAGNDSLYAGGGPTVLAGGDDNDVLVASRGRHLLLGGQGADRLDASVGDNLAVAGITDYDSHHVALASLLREWSSSASYDSRISHLSGDSVGLNGDYLLDDDTVRDDDAIDTVIGGVGQNWYFTRETSGVRRDQVTRRKTTERTVRL